MNIARHCILDTPAGHVSQWINMFPPVFQTPLLFIQFIFIHSLKNMKLVASVLYIILFNNSMTRNPDFQSHIHKGPPTIPILNRINPPIHCTDVYFCKMHSNIVLPFRPRYLQFFRVHCILHQISWCSISETKLNLRRIEVLSHP